MLKNLAKTRNMKMSNLSKKVYRIFFLNKLILEHSASIMLKIFRIQPQFITEYLFLNFEISMRICVDYLAKNKELHFKHLNET